MYPSFRNLVIITDFQLNRFTVAQEHCENLEIDTSCQGTCHLVKKIKKESTEEKNSPFTASDNLKNELLFLESENNDHSIFSSTILTNFSFLLHDFDAHPSAVFHPPKSSFWC